MVVDTRESAKGLREDDYKFIMSIPEVIESSSMRRAFQNSVPILCETDLAVIIGNSRASLTTKIDLLSRVSTQTENHELKERLNEWIRIAKSSKSKKKLESLSEELFESRFVNFTAPFAKGDIVRMARDERRHGILMQGGMIISEEELQKRFGKLDYSDVQFRVEWLGDDGKFYHEHINPLYLDYHVPQEDDSDYEALTEASLLVKGNEGSSLQGFQMACEQYARNCNL